MPAPSSMVFFLAKNQSWSVRRSRRHRALSNVYQKISRARGVGAERGLSVGQLLVRVESSAGGAPSRARLRPRREVS